MSCFLQKQVSCPSCKTILLYTGSAGETVKVTCPSYGMVGKVRFEQLFDALTKIVEPINLIKTVGRFTVVNNLNLTIYNGELYGLF